MHSTKWAETSWDLNQYGYGEEITIAFPMKETPVTYSTQVWQKLCFLQLMVVLCPLQSI